MRRTLLILLVLAAVAVGLIRTLRWLPRHDDGLVRVVEVIDGDTIVIAGGEQVRYIGIDTPETTAGHEQCYGDEATERNRELVAGKLVFLEAESTDRDQYGRLLRHVTVDGVSVELALVASGFARALYIEPDVRTYPTFKAAEDAARNAQLGLWGACY
jgi:micrococcal nuclease